MKKTLLLMCAFIASIGAWAQTNLASGKSPVILKNNTGNSYTTEQLAKITDGNTGNSSEYGLDIAKKEGDPAVEKIDNFYIDLGAEYKISAFESTFTGLRPNNLYIYGTNTVPAADTDIEGGTTPDGYTELYGAAYASDGGDDTPYIKTLASKDTENSFRYIVVVPKGFPYSSIRIQEFKVFQYEVSTFTTFTATASATTLNPSGTATITTSAKDQFGTDVAATVTYTSDNTSVVTVDASGNVTAVANGTANVTVSATYNEVNKSQVIAFTVESPFAAPATIATEPTADAENVIAIFSQKYGKVGVKDNNVGWGGGPNPLWTSFEDVVISDHTLKHVVGTGYADRPAAEITATYTKAFVALYPKSATSGKLYADGGYASAETFTLTPGEWNYIQVPFAKATNYVGVELVGETEFYLDHFYVTKPAADALDITLGSNGNVTVTGPLNATNKSELNVADYAEAVAFNLTGATVAEGTGAVETKSANAVVIANAADETKLAGTENLCHLVGEWMVFAKNGDTAPTVTFTDNAPVYTGGIYSKDNDVTYNYSRTFTGYATFSFPAAVEIPTGVTAYTFTKYADNQVTFTKVGDAMLTKNTPYVLYAASEATISYSGSATTENGLDMRTVGTATDNGATFTANYNVLTTDGEQYILSGDEIKKGNGVKIGGFRAYFTGVAAANGARVQFIDGDVTKIGAIDADGQLNVGEFYNLSGQRVQNPTKGLYIVNGKKVIIK